MRAEDVKYLKNFTLYEIENVCSDIKTVSFKTIQMLDELRNLIKKPIAITEINLREHSPASQHYPKNTISALSEAVDFKILGGYANNEILQLMLDVGFTGIGIYKTFFHGDTRIRHKIWKRIKGIYLPIV